MKAKEVMQIVRISNPTLSSYVKKGWIKVTTLDAQEIFEEIVSLLHCYSVKLYSKRRLDKLKELIEDKSVE